MQMLSLRRWIKAGCLAWALAALAGVLPGAWAATGDDTVVQAREALGRKDKVQLAASRASVNAGRLLRTLA